MEDGSSTNQELEKVDDDVGKDDMFVDAEEELNPESRDWVSAAETVELWKDGVNGNQSIVISKAENGYSESQAMDIQEERDLYAREISSLWLQMKAFKSQQPFGHVNNGDVLADRFSYGEEPVAVSSDREAYEASVQGMISECSKLVSLALEEHRHMEETIKQLHAVISTRDQQIEDLNTKFSELAADGYEKERSFDDAATRILDSLASVVGQEEPLGEIASEKFVQVEKRTALLIQQYHHTLYQIDCLWQCLAETCSVSVDLRLQNGCSDVISSACSELIKAKRKEANLAEKITQVEKENRRLLEKLNKEKAAAEAACSESGQLKVELELEKTRCVNVKEKLGLAVTKGKSLVQQRDSLKQSLAEKTRELERCLNELDEKNRALGDAEKTKEELANCENLIALLQENISQRNLMLVGLEEILADARLPNGMQAVEIVDKCRWIVDDRASLQEIALEFERLQDLLTLIEIPQSIQSSDFGARVVWLRDSFYDACKQAEKIRNEIVCTREVTQNGFDRLSALLSIALVEKEYLQLELDDQVLLYNEIVKMKNEISQEKDQLIRLLLEHSEGFVGSQLGDSNGLSLSDYSMAIERCFEKIKSQNNPEILLRKSEFLDEVQCLLYMWNLDLKLYEEVFEQEMVEKSLHLTGMSNELQTLSKELSFITEEKGSLQKDLDRSKEKYALLREKLSTTVKKGKGLVQDRENFKQQIEEKNVEIEQLKNQIQLLESSLTECGNQRDRLATDLKRVEEDIFTHKNWKDELENTQMEKDKLLASLIEAIGSICPVSSLGHAEPVEKLEWLAGYLVDCQKAKEHVEHELVKLREESNNLEHSLDEVNANLERLQDVELKFDQAREKASEQERSLLEAKAHVTALEDSLSAVQDDIFQLSEEKRVLEVGISHMEEELQKANEEVSSQTRLLVEANNSKISLEDIRSQLENEIIVLTSVKEAADAGRAEADKHLAEVKGDLSFQKSKLEDAYQTIKSLEEELSDASNNLSALRIEKEAAQTACSAAEVNLVKLKEELVDAHQTMESLKEAISQLKSEANHIDSSAAEEEIQKIKEETNVKSSKLAEAFATIKSLGDASAELEKKVNLYTEQNHYLGVARADSENALKKLQEDAASKTVELEDAFSHIKFLEDSLEKSKSDILMLEKEKKAHAQEIMLLDSQLKACMEDLATANGSSESKLLELTGFVNDLQAVVHDNSLSLLMKETFKNKLESLKGMNNIILGLKRQCSINSGSGGVSRNEDDLIFTGPFPGDIDDMMNGELEIVYGNGANLDSIAALFGSTLQACHLKKTNLIDEYKGFSMLWDNVLAALSRKLEETRDDMMTLFEDVKSLKQNVEALETCKSEQEKAIASLEENVTNLISACNDATKILQAGLSNALQVSWSMPLFERESGAFDAEGFDSRIGGQKCSETVGELLSVSTSVQTMMKDFECTSKVASMKIQDLERELKEAKAVSVKAMKERESTQIQVSRLETEVEALENQCDQLRLKLDEFRTDNDELRERGAELSINCDLSRQQGELHVSPFPTILTEKLNNIDVAIPSTNLAETAEAQDTQNLKEEPQKHMAREKGSEMLKDELNEASSSLKRVLGLLGSNELAEEQDLLDLKGLLAALENQIIRMLTELESSKTEAQELGTKLSERQKVVDELMDKVKLLGDLLQERSTKPEIVQERSISKEASMPGGSAENEIEDTVVAPVASSAAHVRTVRKGSTDDHLALSIDVESDPLISSPGADEDKGRAFKSLNTSGLVPRQGKAMADRIDGFWVSGSRVLMNRPRARLGFMAYWLVLQMWVLVSFL
ncbi:hypothetical protein MLD38_008450 [Melastoma candidum]|uniref:Uncharacterized protein n=1 Tax=Melastoma candidum TaxID=119954 RepID=A0ACB9RUJ8_9MYRT|nr:hypothetical protein MLD38_008450 [Melastoma candidum]